jgi:hypothetical protein
MGTGIAAVVLLGFFDSIMFPTIFALGAPLWPLRFFISLNTKENLVGAVGIESASRMERRESCGATRPSKELEKKGTELLVP